MTASSELDELNSPTVPVATNAIDPAAVSPDNELPDEVEMTLFEHLEELRSRVLVSLGVAVLSMGLCFVFVRPIVRLLEGPAGGVKLVQLKPGEFFFVSIEVAGYSGLLLATPFILYQIVKFVLPGLTRREQRLVLPAVIGSSLLFIVGLVFGYQALVPAALDFFVSYGGDVVEQTWSIDDYCKFVLLLLFSTALTFQIPVLQVLLGILGLVSSRQMLAGWRYVLLGAVILGAVLTPSTDPLTQGLLSGAVLGLYFSGTGVLKLLGR
ncbi:MAG: twin-arginine translocase subunit TatC [Oscillatoriales cyanobacterium]|nr:MAG: twin-arginine translocase subunit TatC [Oscillatoriales cyanobacterium]